MRLLGRFLRLPRSRQGLLLEAGFLVLAYRAGLAILPSASMLRRGERRAGLAPATAANSRALRDELAWALGAVSKRVPGARCLAQALAARHLFARHGLSSCVRFGGRKKADGSLDAHAWLESGGEVVYGDAHPELFTPIVSSHGPVPGGPGRPSP
jgi:hypothetical protein